MIIAEGQQDAAVPRNAAQVGMLDGIARAIDPRSLAVPNAEHTLDLGSRQKRELLCPRQCREREILVDTRLELDIVRREKPFKKYIISSPAMAYGHGEIFRREAAYAKTHKDLPVGIYFGAGVLEAADPLLEGMGEIVSGMSHLAGVLATRKYPGLKMTIEYHPWMGHTDVMGTSVIRGLRSLYAK